MAFGFVVAVQILITQLLYLPERGVLEDEDFDSVSYESMARFMDMGNRSPAEASTGVRNCKEGSTTPDVVSK